MMLYNCNIESVKMLLDFIYFLLAMLEIVNDNC